MTSATTLNVEKHAEYIKQLHNVANVGYGINEQLRLSGVYWGLTAMCLLGKSKDLPLDEIFDFTLQCYHPEVGGFAPSVGHDAHLLYTLSGVQILVTLDRLDEFEQKFPDARNKIASYVSSLQVMSGPNAGTFSGDNFGETDTRFLYVAVHTLSLIRKLDSIDPDLAVQHIKRSQNFDGAFGLRPGAESHSGQVFTCVGALAILGRLDIIDKDLLGEWLCERQLPNGGLNGRPEKMEDVCYSWWVLSSLAMIDRLGWIDSSKLSSFILACQDFDNGGISDRPDNMVDVFHTLFGIAGLSLLRYGGLEEVDPIYCMPRSVTNKLAQS